MILQRISYENFRNHRLLSYEPEEGINLVFGLNGSGKTSILEGIHYCALTRGFVSAGDPECLGWNADYFLVRGDFLSDDGREIKVQVSYTKEKEKQVSVNRNEVKPFSSHIGRIPCITFAPSEIGIVTGPPSERRKFIDNAISQTDRRYLEDLMAYRRILAQRNTLLLQLNERKILKDATLTIWSERLAEIAAAIVSRRKGFIDVFSVRLQEMYSELDVSEKPKIAYRCSLPGAMEVMDEKELMNFFSKRFMEHEKTDILRAQTMTGPHRDDLVFLIGEKEIKKYASQGQIRTFLISLKLSQHRYYREMLGENPICLLDDLFSELDVQRTAKILEVLGTFGQSIITSTERKDQRALRAVSIESLKNNEEENT
ncbi:MAG: DNA replication and repair protein RecF [Chlorobiaceae bacterium]|nr:DNA replication and repair protein RecF [Chlorobiaceae bacterium]NTW10197.1 DNA replication and repair protein RecF [Chlorobiaceae bacterium]